MLTAEAIHKIVLLCLYVLTSLVSNSFFSVDSAVGLLGFPVTLDRVLIFQS